MDKRTLKRLGITGGVGLLIASIFITPWIFVLALLCVLLYLIWMITDTID
jgi:hypothetical protein